MVDIQALIYFIYLLFYSLIGVTIIAFALIIAIVVIVSAKLKKNQIIIENRST